MNGIGTDLTATKISILQTLFQQSVAKKENNFQNFFNVNSIVSMETRLQLNLFIHPATITSRIHIISLVISLQLWFSYFTRHLNVQRSTTYSFVLNTKINKNLNIRIIKCNKMWGIKT